ncbi:MAG: NUDIX hydrolase [Dehalococcoidales bacterium]|nr:NUDIX hydrolase [Dehalococcoidales bacterium]
MPEKTKDIAEKTLKRKYVFEGRLIKVRVDTVATADSRHAEREIVEHPDAVVMVALDKDDTVLLVEQYRAPLGKKLLEIPAGVIEKAEDAEATVIREMQEETGYKPQKVEFLLGFYTSPGFSNEYLHLYLVRDLIPSSLEAEDTAGIELVRVPVSQVNELILSGRIQDAKTIAGLLLFLEYRKTR